MKKLTSAQVRKMFLDFFKEKGHAIEPSASLIPVDDPSLLWINSGVATLKNILMAVSFRIIRAFAMCKSPFVQTTLKMSGKRRATIHFSKCSEIFRLAIILNEKPFIGHGNF